MYVVVGSKCAIRGLIGRVAQPARLNAIGSATSAKEEPSEQFLAGPRFDRAARRAPQEYRVATEDPPHEILENGLPDRGTPTRSLPRHAAAAGAGARGSATVRPTLNHAA